MKNSIVRFCVLSALSLSSISAFAECTDQNFLESIDLLKMYSQRPSEGASLAQPITVDKMFEYAPLSEDFGVERIGPTTFARIYKDYLNDLERRNVRLSKDVADRDLSTLNRLCEEAQKRGGDSADVMQIFSETEKTHGSSAFLISGLLFGLTLAFVFWVKLSKDKSARSEEMSKSNVIALPEKAKKSSMDAA